MRFVTLLLLLIVPLFSSLAADPPITDDVIYDKVRLALANDRDVKGVGITVKVTEGVVELDGTVRHEKQRVSAEKTARKVKGVEKVVNRLKVAPL